MKPVLVMVGAVACASVSPASHRTTTVRPDDRDEATEFASHAICVALADRLLCPADHEPRAKLVTSIEAGPSGCEVWCEDRTGLPRRDGPFASARFGDESTLRGQYAHDVPVGAWSQRSASGASKDEHYDPQGRLDSEAREVDAHGTTIRIEHFSHGDRIGTYETFYADGKRHQQGSFAASEDHGSSALIRISEPPRLAPVQPHVGHSVPVGEFRTWYPNGRLASTRSFDEAGTPDGAYCAYTEAGGLIACQTFSHGSGVFVEYNDAGKLVLREQLRHGKPDGVTESFDDEGRLLQSATYRAGELDGPYREDTYDGAGHAILRGRYCHGAKCGEWLHRSESGERESDSYDNHGELVGHSAWNTEGERYESWTREGERRSRHEHCLRALAAGGCCVPEEEPPAGASMCHNGDRH